MTPFNLEECCCRCCGEPVEPDDLDERGCCHYCQLDPEPYDDNALYDVDDSENWERLWLK